uniref:MADF domain-containing protein n=1 Tax=Heliothis virescens TaxID=7102 RepID=A0A2A4IW36_HELVI
MHALSFRAATSHGYYYVSDVAALRPTPVSPLSPCPSVSLERFRYNNVNFAMMDSNSNSYDIIYSPKIEIDSESERDYSKRDLNSKFKVHWNSDNTMKLIETMEKECRELWDIKNPLNKDRNARQVKFEYLAEIFGTTSEEISRKIHNLRTQFNNELRKIKRRQVTRSGWEYFDALSFLMRAPSLDPLETVDAVNLEVRRHLFYRANDWVCDYVYIVFLMLCF